METQNTKVELKIDGILVRVGYEFLDKISSYIPDTKENKKVFEKLALNTHYEVRENIAAKESINKKTIKLLLKDKRHGLITSLLRNRKVVNILKLKDIKKIILLENPIHCELIAENIDNFGKCDSRKLAKILSNNTDPAVRAKLTLRWNRSISKSIIKKLTKDKDIDVANKAKEYLDQNY
jgi:hypothetical protein